jgi:hypothetical protein
MNPMNRWMSRSRSWCRRSAPWTLVALLAAPGPWSRAAASESDPPTAQVEVEASADPRDRAAGEQRPFAFLVDPSTPGRGTFAVGYTLGVGSGIDADRPVPVALQSAGVTNQFFLGYGVTSWFEPMAEVMATTSDGSTFASATLGAKFQLTSPDSPWRAAVMTGALREGATGGWGAWLRGCGSFGTGPLLVELNAYAERVFLSGRDAIDYAVMGGASWRFLDWFRAGAEYVGQDLEELAEGGAEGGARQGVGPSVHFELDRGRYQIVAATLFGIGRESPTAVIRLGLLGTF